MSVIVFDCFYVCLSVCLFVCLFLCLFHLYCVYLFFWLCAIDFVICYWFHLVLFSWGVHDREEWRALPSHRPPADVPQLNMSSLGRSGDDEQRAAIPSTKPQ